MSSASVAAETCRVTERTTPGGTLDPNANRVPAVAADDTGGRQAESSAAPRHAQATEAGAMAGMAAAKGDRDDSG